jgi:hypothetical protein
MQVWIVVLLAAAVIAGYWLGYFIMGARAARRDLREYLAGYRAGRDQEWPWPKNPCK